MVKDKTRLESFQEWFKSQTKYRSQAEFARAIEIPESTIRDYLRGKYKPSEERCKILYEVTGLECFRTEIKLPEEKEEKKEVEIKGISEEAELPLHIQLQNWFKSQTKYKTKKEFAEDIEIDKSTIRRWFSGIRQPSKENRQKLYEITGIEALKPEIEVKEGKELRERGLWVKILNWWKTQHRYPTIRELADEIGWDAQNLSNHFKNKDMPPKLVIEKIAKTVGFDVVNLDSVVKKARQKTERIKRLLLVLEEDLRCFRNGSKDARDIFRKELDPYDIGYISSLLTMLGEEEKFKRWLALTTNRFNFFKNKRGEK